MRGKYTLAWQLEVALEVKAGQSGAGGQSVGIPLSSLSGQADGTVASVASEQMEIARSRAEKARLKMGVALQKCPRRTLRRMGPTLVLSVFCAKKPCWYACRPSGLSSKASMAGPASTRNCWPEAFRLVGSVCAC